MNKDVVKILIDDIEVEGIVTHRSAGDYGVVITKPFCNLTGGSHVPYFARSHCSFEGDYGDASIRATLKKLYTLGKYLAREMKNLKEKVKDYNEIITKLSSEMINEQDFKIKRISLKKRLRDGEIDNKGHH